jgi:hypothetical protein
MSILPIIMLNLARLRVARWREYFVKPANSGPLSSRGIAVAVPNQNNNQNTA